MEITPSGAQPSPATLNENLAVARAGRERAQAKIERLERANRAKDAFLSELAHELRTPLTAILGWASLLQVRQFDPEVIARGLQTIEVSARAQAQLIDDLSDLSRVASGKMRLEMLPMDLNVAVRGALEAVRPEADAKGVSLLESLSPSQYPVLGDRNRLRQVVGNFLTNAVKFTPSGGSVTVELARTGDCVRLFIRDTGVGISPEFLPYVFDRFRQAEVGLVPPAGSLGLGLAIVRHLVEMHGGSVTAQSDGVGRGAAFMIELPEAPIAALKDQASPAPEAATAIGVRVLEGVHLLLVEDDEASRKAIAALLEEAGADVLATSSVNEAMLAVAQRRPDVVVSDIRMPGHDGFALVRRLRAAEAAGGEHIPIVALTGGGRKAGREHALAQGFELYIHKPVDGLDLAHAVAGMVPVPMSEAASSPN